jgi:hypothetical protein
MKSNDSLYQGTLKPEAFAPFAQYLSRYVSAYKAEGVPIFALTLQNEPHFEPADYPGMRVDPAKRAAFIGGYLGPGAGAAESRHPDLRLGPQLGPAGLAARGAGRPGRRKVRQRGGVALLRRRRQGAGAGARQFPGKDTWFTECSGGQWDHDFAHNLQYFTRTLVIGTTRGWARGVSLWNLALDENYGPHKGGCGDCRGVVTIDSKTGAVTRNVEYYALAHASRFVRPGARRIASTSGCRRPGHGCVPQHRRRDRAAGGQSGETAARFFGAQRGPAVSATRCRPAAWRPSPGTRRRNETAHSQVVRAPQMQYAFTNARISDQSKDAVATIKDVARLAGVGLGTASRVVSGKGSVSPATLERVKGHRAARLPAVARGARAAVGLLAHDRRVHPDPEGHLLHADPAD